MNDFPAPAPGQVWEEVHQYGSKPARAALIVDVERGRFIMRTFENGAPTGRRSKVAISTLARFYRFRETLETKESK
jgi:hypothetical protein